MYVKGHDIKVYACLRIQPSDLIVDSAPSNNTFNLKVWLGFTIHN